MRDNTNDYSLKFKQAYIDYHDIIYKYCYSRLGEYNDLAEDCMQNVFIVYYEKLVAGENIKIPKAYLYKIAENVVRKTNSKQRRQKNKTIPLEEVYNLAAPEIDLLAAELDYDEIKEILLSNLSEEEQLLYEQKYVQRMSLKEIAKDYEIRPEAAATRVSRLRKKIIKLINPVLEKYKNGDYV